MLTIYNSKRIKVKLKGLTLIAYRNQTLKATQRKHLTLREYFKFSNFSLLVLL
ncbi:IS3 family transposase [Aliivibrio fischeri]|uniref:IS3 family transposase n=1 Tax=Aliivibrio fischeri TaxID=668 RepID=UPI00345DDCB1